MTTINNIEKYKPIIQWFKFLFTLTALIFICYATWKNHYNISKLFLDAQINWLIISISLWILLHFISPIFTSKLLKNLSLKLNYKKALIIHITHLPAKYIPGGVWHSVARAGDYYRSGLSSRQVGSYLLIENIVVATVTLMLGGLIVMHIDNIDAYWLFITITCCVISTFVLLILPFILNKRLLTLNTTIHFIGYLSSISLMLIYWIVACLSFISYLKAFPDLGFNMSEVEISGVYLFSWGIGFVTIFAPQGIGISEVVTTQLLQGSLSIESLIVIIAGFRIIVLIADLLTWLFSLIFISLSIKRL